MASFCPNCKFPQTPNVAFCTNCGVRQTSAPPPTTASQPPFAPPGPRLPAPAKSGGALKVVLIAVVCLAVAGVMMIAGLLYIGHRVKQAVVAKAKSYGVELPVTASPHGGPVRIPKACDALSQTDASRLLGEPIARTQSDGDSCTYFGPPGLYAKLAQEKMKKAVEQVKKGGDPQNPDLPTAVDQTAPVVLPGVTGAAYGADAPLLILVIGNDGKAQMAAMLATAGLFGGIYKAAGDGGHSPIAEVPNLGDRAVRLPKLGLNVLKGDVIIRVVPGPVEDADAKTVTIAKELLNKL